MKTIQTEIIGKITLRLVDTGKGHVGLLLKDGKQLGRIDGNDAIEVWSELRASIGKASEAYFGFDGARSRFKEFFPDGFGSVCFDERERNYKLAAKSKLDSLASLEKALDGKGLGPAILSVYQATNLLSPFEKTRLQPLLRGPDADLFVQTAARFALGEIAPALKVMDNLLAKYDNAKWTVVTYLPFLWRPDLHMFLKPVVTQDFADRVGHSFVQDYSAQLDGDVYESLLDLMGTTKRELATLHPRDNIDLQSFVWVVGQYEESDHTVASPSSENSRVL